MRIPLWTSSLALSLLLGCAPVRGDDDDSASLAPAVRITVDNQGFTAIEQLTWQLLEEPPTDGEIPLPPQGLEEGARVSDELPGPGGYRFDAQGAGCTANIETPEPLTEGEDFVWTIGENDLLCFGG